MTNNDKYLKILKDCSNFGQALTVAIDIAVAQQKTNLEQVASALEISVRTLQRIQENKAECTVSMLFNLVHVLENTVVIDWISLQCESDMHE